MQNNLYSLRRDLVEAGRRVYARGYVASNDGNISARVDSNRVLITPTGVSKGYMKPEDMVLVNMEGKVLEGRKKPSSEVFMHLKIYKERSDVNSVCHAHPPYATGFAVAGIPLKECILPEVIIILGGIPLAEYGTPGTEEFYTPLLKYLKNYDAFLLANHGALTIGKDIFNAYYKMETLEHFAHITFVATQLGQVNTLNPEQTQKLFDIRKRIGITQEVACESCDASGGTCSIVTSGQNQPVTSISANPAGLDKELLVKQVTEAILKQLNG